MSTYMTSALDALEESSGYYQGWKLHLNVGRIGNEAGWDKRAKPVEDLLNNLKDQGIIKNFKFADKGQYGLGKDFTVYIGDRDQAEKAAQIIEEKAGNFLLPQTGEALKHDQPFTSNKIVGRFQVGSTVGREVEGHPSFTYYGSKGIPLTKDTPEWGSLTQEQQKAWLAHSDSELKKVFGAEYTGTSGKPIVSFDAEPVAKDNSFWAPRDEDRIKPIASTASNAGPKDTHIIDSNHVPASTDQVIFDNSGPNASNTKALPVDSDKLIGKPPQVVEAQPRAVTVTATAANAEPVKPTDWIDPAKRGHAREIKTFGPGEADALIARTAEPASYTTYSRTDYQTPGSTVREGLDRVKSSMAGTAAEKIKTGGTNLSTRLGEKMWGTEPAQSPVDKPVPIPTRDDITPSPRSDKPFVPTRDDITASAGPKRPPLPTNDDVKFMPDGSTRQVTLSPDAKARLIAEDRAAGIDSGKPMARAGTPSEAARVALGEVEITDGPKPGNPLSRTATTVKNGLSTAGEKVAQKAPGVAEKVWTTGSGASDTAKLKLETAAEKTKSVVIKSASLPSSAVDAIKGVDLAAVPSKAKAGFTGAAGAAKATIGATETGAKVLGVATKVLESPVLRTTRAAVGELGGPVGAVAMTVGPDVGIDVYHDSKKVYKDLSKGNISTAVADASNSKWMSLNPLSAGVNANDAVNELEKGQYYNAVKDAGRVVGLTQAVQIGGLVGESAYKGTVKPFVDFMSTPGVPLYFKPNNNAPVTPSKLPLVNGWKWDGEHYIEPGGKVARSETDYRAMNGAAIARATYDQHNQKIVAVETAGAKPKDQAPEVLTPLTTKDKENLDKMAGTNSGFNGLSKITGKPTEQLGVIGKDDVRQVITGTFTYLDSKFQPHQGQGVILGNGDFAVIQPGHKLGDSISAPYVRGDQAKVASWVSERTSDQRVKGAAESANSPANILGPPAPATPAVPQHPYTIKGAVDHSSTGNILKTITDPNTGAVQRVYLDGYSTFTKDGKVTAVQLSQSDVDKVIIDKNISSQFASANSITEKTPALGLGLGIGGGMTLNNSGTSPVEPPKKKGIIATLTGGRFGGGKDQTSPGMNPAFGNADLGAGGGFVDASRPATTTVTPGPQVPNPPNRPQAPYTVINPIAGGQGGLPVFVNNPVTPTAKPTTGGQFGSAGIGNYAAAQAQQQPGNTFEQVPEHGRGAGYSVAPSSPKPSSTPAPTGGQFGSAGIANYAQAQAAASSPITQQPTGPAQPMPVDEDGNPVGWRFATPATQSSPNALNDTQRQALESALAGGGQINQNSGSDDEYTIGGNQDQNRPVTIGPIMVSPSNHQSGIDKASQNQPAPTDGILNITSDNRGQYVLPD